MERYYGEKRDEYGRVEPYATVSVFESGTDTLATIYDPYDTADTPSTAIGNPLQTDANGRYGFAAQNGDYDIVCQGSGSKEYRVRVNLFDSTTSSPGGAGGNNTEVQYNSGGVLTGAPGLTTDGNSITAKSVKFNTSSPVTTNVQGNTYWDTTNTTLSTVIDATNGVVLQHGQEIHIACVNSTLATITNGQAVYINDAQGNRPTCALAKADNIATCQVVGVATQDIAKNATGMVTVIGKVNGINTFGYSADGVTLYLSATTAGALTETEPTSPNYVVRVGLALNTTPNGSIFVNPNRPLAADTTMATNTDEVCPTQKAVKAYANSAAASAAAGALSTAEAYTDTLRSDLASTSSTALGDAIIGVKSALMGGVARTQHDKNGDTLDAADFTSLQAALTAANGNTLYLAPTTYNIASTGTYALTVPASIKIVGIPGQTVIKLSSASVDCAILGTALTSTYFEMEGVTLDGNSSVVSSVNVNGLRLPDARVVISRNNTYQNLKDLGSFVGGHGIYAANASLCEKVSVAGDTFTSIGANAVQTYYAAQVTVRDCYGTGMLTSFTDINGQVIPGNTRAKTQLNNNVIVCDSTFSTALSVLSLMGDDVECTGNKITGGGTQIVVHAGSTEVLHNYLVSGNFLWSSKGVGIVVNQTGGASAKNYSVIVSNNSIYQPTQDGIAVLGTYAGSGATNGSTVITGNILHDGLGTQVNPSSPSAGIRCYGATNVTLNGNVCYAPRWAGICLFGEGRNFTITGNTINDHQGLTTVGTGTGAQCGGGIFVGGSTTYLGDINIVGNVVRNYATSQSGSTTTRAGGIVINEAATQNVSVKNNIIHTGNAAGISVLSSVNVIMESNEVQGYFGVPINTVNGIGTGCVFTNALSYVRYGTTATRNAFVLTTEQVGFNYWDTSLTKPIWWNGTVWKDASNGTV